MRRPREQDLCLVRVVADAVEVGVWLGERHERAFAKLSEPLERRRDEVDIASQRGQPASHPSREDTLSARLRRVAEGLEVLRRDCRQAPQPRVQASKRRGPELLRRQREVRHRVSGPVLGHMQQHTEGHLRADWPAACLAPPRDDRPDGEVARKVLGRIPPEHCAQPWCRKPSPGHGENLRRLADALDRHFHDRTFALLG